MVTVALVTGDPSRKDVIVAVLGASAALGGFVLVFLGLLISAYQSYAADAARAVRATRKRAAWEMFAVFPLCIATIGVALAWLLFPGCSALYWLAVGMFAAELVAIVVVAAIAAARLLK